MVLYQDILWSLWAKLSSNLYGLHNKIKRKNKCKKDNLEGRGWKRRIKKTKRLKSFTFSKIRKLWQNILVKVIFKKHDINCVCSLVSWIRVCSLSSWIRCIVSSWPIHIVSEKKPFRNENWSFVFRNLYSLFQKRKFLQRKLICCI